MSIREEKVPETERGCFYYGFIFLFQFLLVFPFVFLISQPFLHMIGSVIVTKPRETPIYREILLFFVIALCLGYSFARLRPDLRVTAVLLGVLPTLQLLFIAGRELFVEPGWSIGLWNFLPQREGLAAVFVTLPLSTGAGYALGAYLSRFLSRSTGTIEPEQPPALPSGNSHS